MQFQREIYAMEMQILHNPGKAPIVRYIKTTLSI